MLLLLNCISEGGVLLALWRSEVGVLTQHSRRQDEYPHSFLPS